MGSRDSKGRFAAGSSGNPAGRPKRTDQEREIIESMGMLVPQAITIIRDMLGDKEMPAYLRLRAAEIVFERVAGKPMTSMEMDHLESDRQIEEMFGFTLGK